MSEFADVRRSRIKPEIAAAASRAAERVARRVRDALDRKCTMRSRKETPRPPGDMTYELWHELCRVAPSA